MAAREAELADLVAARRGDIATYQNRLAVQAKESEEAEAKILSQTAQLEAAGETVAALADERGARLAAVNEQESQVRALRDSLNDLRDLRGKQEVRQTQLQLRIENLAEHVMRRYQIDLRTFTTDAFAFQKTLSVVTKRRAGGSSAPPLDANNGGEAATISASPAERPIHPDVDNLEQIIAELTRQLDNMGPVNLEAVHEYDELEERYRFLETQNNDLIAARREVLDVITRINSTTQKLFAETFAQVRINFREMFGELFDGGRADLSLVDENDPLNCGIEISARPPGKQLQSISLLSGGERTMTAVALLFAIYMVRPSPFCILDEMDAPLDESNINRFIRVLERFVSQSQFIIITHNKRTIAKADILYGVTMEERGVSKLVGMKLTEERGSDGELKKQASNGNGTDGAGTEAAPGAVCAGERIRRASPRGRSEPLTFGGTCFCTSHSVAVRAMKNGTCRSTSLRYRKKTLCAAFGSMAKSWDAPNRRTRRFHFEKSAAREIPRGVPHHAPDADFRGEARESLPGRSDYRRRLHRQRPGSGQRGLRDFFAEGRCLRAAHSRSGRALRFR